MPTDPTTEASIRSPPVRCSTSSSRSRDEEQHGYAIMRRVEELTDGAVTHGPGHALRRDQAHARRRPDRGDRRAARPRARRPAPALLPRHRPRRARVRAPRSRGSRRCCATHGARPSWERVMRGARTYRVLICALPAPLPARVRRPDGAALTDLDARPRTARVGAARSRRSSLTIPYQYWEALMATTPHDPHCDRRRRSPRSSRSRHRDRRDDRRPARAPALLAWELYAILRMRGHGVGRSSRIWWKFLLAGVGVFAAIFVIFALPWPESWRSEVPGERRLSTA